MKTKEKKVLIGFFLAICMLLTFVLGSISANSTSAMAAEDNVVEVASYAEFRAAITDDANNLGKTIRLTQDIAQDLSVLDSSQRTTYINSSRTLDLNGHNLAVTNITNQFLQIRGGEFTLTDDSASGVGVLSGTGVSGTLIYSNSFDKITIKGKVKAMCEERVLSVTSNGEVLITDDAHLTQSPSHGAVTVFANNMAETATKTHFTISGNAKIESVNGSAIHFNSSKGVELNVLDNAHITTVSDDTIQATYADKIYIKGATIENNSSNNAINIANTDNVLLIIENGAVAKISGNPKTVTYYENGAESGSVPVDYRRYFFNQEVTISGNTGNLVKAGYTFSNWKAIDGMYYDFNSKVKIRSDVVLQANWQTPSTGGGTGGSTGGGTGGSTGGNPTIDNGDKGNTGIIIVIILICVLFLIILCYIILYVCWKKKDKKPLKFLVPSFRSVNNLLFKTKLNNMEKQAEEQQSKDQNQDDSGNQQ